MKVDRLIHSRDSKFSMMASCRVWNLIQPAVEPHDAAGRHLGFGQTGNSAARSAVPENPTIEPNIKWIR